MKKIDPSEITPEHLYLSRRRFIKGAGAVAAGSILAACGPTMINTNATPEQEDGLQPQASTESDELGDVLTDFNAVTNYNNYYEFSLDKRRVADLSADFQTSPWTVEVGGLVANPGIYDIDDLRSQFDQEERIYRLRCVEGWSMVIPWNGFTLASLLNAVEPLNDARYVRLETAVDPEAMDNANSPYWDWPYIEGLRLDEAMNDLPLMATGLYGKTLLPQNGAPVRLVVPWKYGFKSIKSIVRIDLVEEMPISFWMAAASNEYGFYANVNPEVDHPRWSQASERRIGELDRRPTLMFNGYEDEVAHLYDGMDLRVNF
jgi:sulfoxide reductase catalytic subunit YedY